MNGTVTTLKSHQQETTNNAANNCSMWINGLAPIVLGGLNWARILSRRRENHTASTTMYCTVQTTLPTVDPLYKKKYNSILGDRIMPCSGTAGASRITNANEGSTLAITTMQRIANFFFPTSGGKLFPSHPLTPEQLCPPAAGAPKLGLQDPLLPPMASM